MSIAYIGIGSNLGNRRYHCLKAVELLEQNGQTVSKISSLYETDPWGVTDQPRFINMAVEIETELLPKELLDLLKRIEKRMGRGKTVRWGPRVIDLDILFYDDLTVNDSDLVIPHPLMQTRAFVLEPLAEIAPGKVHPVLRRNVATLLRENTRSGASGKMR
jgi:2-amino-4-hydroxy-6-hydroxymethyldihydropteridine diphosphokinase